MGKELVKFDKSIQPPAGWVSSEPLQKFSSLHELSLIGMLGLKTPWPKMQCFIEFNCNLNTPLTHHSKAHFVFDTRDDQLPPSSYGCAFSIKQLRRWRIQVQPNDSFEDFIHSLNKHQRQNYAKAKKKYKAYDCQTLLIEDWSQYSETVYLLYSKVAQKHGKNWLYDLQFFEKASKRKEYQLLSAWFDGQMIGAFLLLDEYPTLHGFCCGVDYEHSRASCTYSWMNYEFIKYAFQKRYQTIDVGITADECKKSIGFKPVPTRIDVYSKGIVTRILLRFMSLFLLATINSNGKLKTQLTLWSKDYLEPESDKEDAHALEHTTPQHVE